jgi:hypothetical protein
MDKNSRTYARNLPAKFGFIQIVGDEGGQILNFSEAGLCFETFAPIGQPKKIQFWFSLNLRDRIEATGEVAWLDAETKMGGLRFLNPTERLLKHIRLNSAEQYGAEVPARGQGFLEALSKRVSSLAALESNPRPSDASLDFKSKTEGYRSHSLLDSSVNTARPLPASVNSTDLISLQRHVAVCRRQLIIGMLLGILFSSLVAIPIFSYFSSRNRSGSPQAAARNDIPASANSEAGPGATSGNANVPAALNISTPKNVHQSVATHPYPDYAAKGNLPLSPSPFLEGNRAPTAVSRAVQLQKGDTTVARKSGATPQQLWSAVQAGDTNAAVLLADRYLRGDGVPVNCLQARVLLLVASEKNNPAATKKLHELDKNGCS